MRKDGVIIRRISFSFLIFALVFQKVYYKSPFVKSIPPFFVIFMFKPKR